MGGAERGIPCAAVEICPIAEAGRECFEDVHHRYYPAAEYRSRLEKEFRELRINKELGCRAIHNFRHATEEPPEKPPAREMRAAIVAEKQNRNRERGVA